MNELDPIACNENRLTEFCNYIQTAHDELEKYLDTIRPFSGISREYIPEDALLNASKHYEAYKRASEQARVLLGIESEGTT